MTRHDARRLIERLLPLVETESVWLTPMPRQVIGAKDVFDAIRETCDSPMSEEEFNVLADEAQEARP